MRLVIALMLALWALPAMAQSVTPAQVLQAAVDEVIRPGMVTLKNRASGLASAMQALCAVPSAGALQIASGQFRQTALAYGRIEAIRIGPLLEENRAERLLFWPDRKGIALRQVQAILAEGDESATSPVTLLGKSVAVQGLGALEFVLFGTGAEVLTGPEGAFRCRYGLAVAQSVATVAQELAVGWYAPEGIALRLTAPAAEFADYRTETEALEALLGLLSHGIEAVRDTRINPVLAQGERAAQPKLGLFWRAGLTVPMLRANIAGLRDLFTASRIAQAVGEKDQGLDNSIAFEFRNAFRALDLVTLPLEAALADEKQAFALTYLVIVTQSLQVMLGEQLSAALGLSVGFSSLDGD